MQSERIAPLVTQLNSFDAAARAAALRELVAAADGGTIVTPPPSDTANMHAHTFFSFNAYGYSPSALVWLARQRGFGAIGMVDFDVLDGVDEFMSACETAGVRGSAGIETRVFLPEFATREINSPGEPGVLYHMGIGFTSSHVPKTVAPIAADLRSRAAQRNREMVTRLNAYLQPVSIDYEANVVSLTPGGTPTERHIVLAYVHAAEQQTAHLTVFWSDKLGMTTDQVASAISDSPKFQNLVRTKLMKRGGPGYMQPDAGSFPRVEPFHQLIEACGALPCAAWLDGTLPGEQSIEELLTLLIGKGAVALNIIPDRNWNLPDPEQKRLKIEKLNELVLLARDLDLPLNVGTEMNSFGQKLIDDFDAPEIAPLRRDFMDGAYFIYGHTAMQRQCGMGYMSDWAKAALPTRRERNAFYTQAGRQLAPQAASPAVDTTMTATDVLKRLIGT
ncbi:MAG: hypothetical protein SF123_18900 [Chloroflexota bacterium]|nr:hypothetical protein [Chloroflexota bacterium]